MAGGRTSDRLSTPLVMHLIFPIYLKVYRKKCTESEKTLVVLNDLRLQIVTRFHRSSKETPTRLSLCQETSNSGDLLFLSYSKIPNPTKKKKRCMRKAVSLFQTNGTSASVLRQPPFYNDVRVWHKWNHVTRKETHSCAKWHSEIQTVKSSYCCTPTCQLHWMYHDGGHPHDPPCDVPAFRDILLNVLVKVKITCYSCIHVLLSFTLKFVDWNLYCLLHCFVIYLWVLVSFCNMPLSFFLVLYYLVSHFSGACTCWTEYGKKITIYWHKWPFHRLLLHTVKVFTNGAGGFTPFRRHLYGRTHNGHDHFS